MENLGAADPDGKVVEETAQTAEGLLTKEELATQATKLAIEQGHLPKAKAEFPETRIIASGAVANSKIIGTIDSFKENNSRGVMSVDVTNKEVSEPVEVNLRTLLEAGAHFGHQTSRWNPAMAP